jgi:hypothetical protein
MSYNYFALQITRGKQAMTFKKGTSGNPAGRVKGSQNKRSQLAKLFEPYAEELVAKVVEMARNGDINALRLCLERLIPKASHETISITLPELDMANRETLGKIYGEILNKASGQEITLNEAKTLSSILKLYQEEMIPIQQTAEYKQHFAELLEKYKRDY